MTTTSNISTAVAGSVATYSDLEFGDALKTETSLTNAIYRLFNVNERKDIPKEMESGEFLARQIMEALGVENVDKELEKYFNEHGYWQAGWFFDDYIDQIAEDMNVSKRQLMYMFRTYIDLTPIDYMNKFRVSNACALLKQRDIKVEQVSEMVGIEDEKYFMRLFKKVVGMTPKEYRQNCEDDDPFVWLKEKNIDLR